MEIFQNHPLAPYTTVKIGGPADTFIITHTTDEFIEAIKSYMDNGTNEANGAQRAEAISRKESSTGNSFVNQNMVADRFELYINGIEIANGCTENTDSKSILISFNQEKDYRIKNNLPLHPIDTSFATNSAKLNLVSGIGLGIDRFLKIINQNTL